MSTKREAAHDAVRRGFTVFPIAPDSKVPLLKENWLQIATTNPAQIDAWWTEHPTANIGGLTGDKLVFDIDPRNGGLATWGVIVDTQDLPKTARTETAGSGAHVIYQAPEGRPVKGGTNKAGPGVDIKAGGGYILLPGSTIGAKDYHWTNDRPIARAPTWAVEMCQRARTRDTSAGKRLLEEDDTARELFEQWIAAKAPRAEYGEIDDKTFEVAARGYDFGCSQDTVHELTLSWNDTHCDGAGDTERLAVVVESAGRNRDNAIGSKHPLASPFDAVEIDESLAPPLAAEQPKPKSTVGLRAENFFAAADLALTDAAEPLIKGVLDRGAMSILYGESNTGKTFIAIDMSFHIALGKAWTGRKTRQGCVVYVAAEGGRGVYKRLAALRKAHPEIKVAPLFVVKFPIDLLHGKEHAQALVKICQDVAAESGQVLELIVIDTLSRAMAGGDENSSTDMGGIVKSFDAIREATGAHLMVIHHSGKDRAKGARGHSLLRAATDTEIEVERGRVTVTKQRDMDGDFEQRYRLKVVNIGRDADGANVTSCVVEHLSAGDKRTDRIDLTPAQKRVVEAIRERLVTHPQDTFGWQFVRSAKLEVGLEAGNSPNALSTAMSNLLEAGWVKKLGENQYVME